MTALAFRGRWWGVAAVFLLVSAAASAAARHELPITSVESPLADIQGVYAWMTPNAARLNLVMTVSPFDDGTTSFGPGVQYVFHVTKHQSLFQSDEPPTTIICQFRSKTDIECWVGTQYVRGNPLSGVTSQNGDIRVFADRRSDPFFFNTGGFGAAIDQLRTVGVASNSFGCPLLAPASATAIVQQLARRPNQDPPLDRFIDTNVLALVLQVDKRLLGGSASVPLLSVWGSTHRQ